MIVKVLASLAVVVLLVNAMVYSMIGDMGTSLVHFLGALACICLLILKEMEVV